METTEANNRIIFGLKVRQRRMELGLSFLEMSEASGLSVSYLNEIEKGKKYPKPEKIKALAKALKVQANDLTSTELEGNLAPVGDLLRSNFLRELPLEFFGIELAKVVELIAMAPGQVGAFISTLVDLSRNYSLREENFYFGALRAYLEMHHNYFEDLEEAAERFRDTTGPLPAGAGRVAELLQSLLTERYGYTVDTGVLERHPGLHGMRAVFIPGKKKLLLQSGLTNVQRAFQFAKELGFQYMGLTERAQTASLLRVHSFEEVLSHFKASYFAAALLVGREAFVEELRAWMRQEVWDEDIVRRWTEKYAASPETIIQRMSNLLPSEFGLRKLFIWRFVQDPATGGIRLDKELNLIRDRLHSRNGIAEHFCRRWPAVGLLKEVNGLHEPVVVAQRAVHHDTGEVFLCFTVARPALPVADHKVSIVLGLLLDDELEKTIRFAADPALENRSVGHTCERCSMADCAERAASPVIYQAREKLHQIRNALEALNAL
ncbi:MAG: helix-turn-helix domain-containing protein [Saprospiraceae bacterium]